MHVDGCTDEQTDKWMEIWTPNNVPCKDCATTIIIHTIKVTMPSKINTALFYDLVIVTFCTMHEL